MSDYVLSDETRAKLKAVSTASVATALYKRGLRNQFIQGVLPVARKRENMVGRPSRCAISRRARIAIPSRFSAIRTTSSALR